MATTEFSVVYHCKFIFLLNFKKYIYIFSSFLQQMNSVRPTRVVCFAWGFPFNLAKQE